MNSDETLPTERPSATDRCSRLPPARLRLLQEGAAQRPRLSRRSCSTSPRSTCRASPSRAFASTSTTRSSASPTRKGSSPASTPPKNGDTLTFNVEAPEGYSVPPNPDQSRWQVKIQYPADGRPLQIDFRAELQRPERDFLLMVRAEPEGTPIKLNDVAVGKTGAGGDALVKISGVPGAQFVASAGTAVFKGVFSEDDEVYLLSALRTGPWPTDRPGRPRARRGRRRPGNGTAPADACGRARRCRGRSGAAPGSGTTGPLGGGRCADARAASRPRQSRYGGTRSGTRFRTAPGAGAAASGRGRRRRHPHPLEKRRRGLMTFCRTSRLRHRRPSSRLRAWRPRKRHASRPSSAG
jgi:hypothetical protein